ncbi:PD-(D/E)XK nuclease family protein [Eubacterium multiforme]|uniref:PD-(D/E)XK nuclease superfamily protein n=1 Tax=Eubacterium multiforme TaxID=83339 RepID=A0ABT9UX39_9FIRM|nr:PD-(D/E)XK nuclease family protein [Eubacterium multiforme]MDQ0150891.1 hypothetical protein [Eubacterium multiforme]
MIEKNNLFKFATSELTNDAMICYLVNLSIDERIEYKNLGKDIINLFTKKRIENIKSIDIIRQYKKIDILIKVNDDELIIIEDKVNTGQHSDQLNRYIKAIEDDNNDDIRFRNKNYVYLKIGNESQYQSLNICYEGKDKLKNNQYLYISRKMLLNVLNNYKDVINNDIIKEYIEYLEDKEELFNSYKLEDKLDKWTWGFEGYFDELQRKKKIKNKCWGFVSNSSGGFLGFWWNFKNKEYSILENNLKQYYIYIQIEAYPKIPTRVVLKVECYDKEVRRDIRNYVWNNLKPLLVDEPFSKTKFADGNWMTIAEKWCETKEELTEAISRAEYILLNLDKKL